MAKTSVKLYMTNKTIEFGSESIVSLEFEQQSTSDYSRPVYDIYPAYGTLVVKDKDLSLYNMALNGEFDNYNYKIEVFTNNSKVARLYITELPVYSFSDKTLSMVLGDELTKANTKIYSGYDYPLEPKTLFDVALAVLKAFDSTITETSAVFTQSNWSATQTYADYLKTISIEYPYVPANRTFRQVFKQLLTVAQSALVTDVNTVYRFVRMDGAKNTSNDNAIGILSSQITSQFQPTIIVPNKYDSCDVDCDKVSVDYNKDKVIETHEFDNININTEADNKYNQEFAFQQESVNSQYYTNVELEIVNNKFSSKVVGQTITKDTDKLYVYLNQNLKKVLDCTYVKDKNPAIQITVKKIIKRIEGTVTLQRDTNPSSSTYTNWLIVHNSFVAKIGATEELVSEEYMSFNKFNQTESFSFGGDYAFDTYNYKTVTCSTTTSTTDKSDNFTKIDDVVSYYKFNFERIIGRLVQAICCEFRAGYTIGDSSSYFTRQDHTYKYTITYEFQKLSITYNGDYTEVVFKDDTATKLKTANVKDNTASISGGEELMQYSVKQANSRPLKIAENTLKVFQNGLNGGDIECIAWDYSYLTKTGQPISYNSTTENLKKFFSVGDMVVPCKDQKGEPVYTRNSATVYFNVVKNAITYLNGGFRQRMILRESVRDISKTKLGTPTISSFDLYVPRYSIILSNYDDDAEKIIVYADGTEIGTVSSNELQRGANLIYFVINQLNGWKDLTVGEHSITIKLTAQGLTDSDLSNSTSIKRGYDITYNLSHVSLVPAFITNEYYSEINQNESLTLSFTVDEGTTFPDTVSVTNATYVWDKSAGTLKLSNATGNVLITITAVQSQITPVISHYGGTTIQLDEIDERTETISVSANSDVIGTVAKLPTVPEEGAPLVTAKSDTEIEVDDIDTNAQKLAIYANGVKIGEVNI